MNLLFWKKNHQEVEPEQRQPPRKLHPKLQQLVDEGWMAEAVTPDGRPLIIDGVQYYEYIRNSEKITYSRLVAYENALIEYNEIYGHAQLLKHHLSITKRLASDIFNYRHTDAAKSELAMQQLIGLSAATEKALETKHPIGFLCNVAAIFFVAENEDPELNDMALQEEKAAKFLKATTFHDFFFTMRVAPLNVLQTLLETSSLLSTVEAYAQLAQVARPMYIASEQDSTEKELNDGLKLMLAMSLDAIDSYEHLFTRLLSNSTTSEWMMNDEPNKLDNNKNN